MGEIKKYMCKCGYSKDIFSGGGLLGCNTDYIGKFFPDEIKRFRKEQDAGQILSYFMENRLFLCPQCQDIMALPVFIYTRENGHTSRFMGACAECGGYAEQIEDEENVKCPKCGQNLSYMKVGNWD